MSKKTVRNISLFVTITWAILLPSCSSAILALSLLIQNMEIISVLPSITSPLIIIICISLTGGILGMPLSFSLARFYNSTSYKWILVCLGWAVAFFVIGLAYWGITSGNTVSNEVPSIYHIRNIISGVIFFAALGFIPGAIGGGVTGIVEKQIIQPKYPFRPFLLSMFWAIAFSVGSGVAYLFLIIQDIYFSKQNTSNQIWIIILALIMSGAISSAIGSRLTFSSYHQAEENNTENLVI